METISLKLQESVAREMDRLSKLFHYNTKTEFIREAIRDKMKALESELFAMKLKKFKGAAKVKVSDERLHELREEVAKEYAKKQGVKLD